MRKSLPANSSLNYLKKEAKALKRNVDDKNLSVSYRISEHLSTYQMGDPLTLSDAQFVIAQEYGFSSWPKLKESLNNPDNQKQSSLKDTDGKLKSERVNITCGDIASATLKNCGVKGQRLPWKDLLCIGPLPNTDDYYQFLIKRSEFTRAWTKLEGLPAPEKMARNEHQFLRNTLSAKAIVFWVWPHLSNQLLLLFLLDWYKKNNYEGELTWVDASGNPERNDEEYVGSLINSEKHFSAEQLIYATRIWDALRQSTPETLISILKEDIEHFPYLNDALWRYVHELPDIKTGLSLQQYRVLESIQSKSQSPRSIYKHVHKGEKYFIAGDWSLWHVIAEMVNAKHPLIETRDKKPFLYPPVDISERFDNQRLSLTENGRKVLKAEITNLDLNGCDRFWGALDISGNRYWQYDSKRQIAVLSPYQPARICS